MSLRPPVLLLFVSRCVSYLIWYFVVCSTVYNGLPCVLPLLVLASVPLLQVLVGCSGVQLLEVVGRVYSSYKFLAVCLAVSDLWLCGRLSEVIGRGFGC